MEAVDMSIREIKPTMEAVDMSIREIKYLVDFFNQRVQDNKTTYILLDYQNNVLKYSLNNASTIHTSTNNDNVQLHRIDGNSQQPPPPYSTTTQHLTPIEVMEMNIRVIKQLVDFFCQRVQDNKPSYILLEYRNNEFKYFLNNTFIIHTVTNNNNVQLHWIDGNPHHRTLQTLYWKHNHHPWMNHIHQWLR